MQIPRFDRAALCLGISLIVLCASGGVSSAEVAPLAIEERNAFAFTLLAKLSRETEAGKIENVVLCPGGVIRLLQALEAGGKGKTAAEIQRALRPAGGTGKIAKSDAEPVPAAAVLRIASAIWCDAATPLDPAYQQAVRERLHLEARAAPLLREPE